MQHHYTQQVDFAQLKSELQLTEKNELAMVKAENDRLVTDIEKLKQRLREEITRTQAGVGASHPAICFSCPASRVKHKILADTRHFCTSPNWLLPPSRWGLPSPSLYSCSRQSLRYKA